MMPEKLCLQWNDFKENVMSAFGNMRHDKEALTYVTRKITFYVIDGQKFQKVENDENRFFAITSSKLFKN